MPRSCHISLTVQIEPFTIERFRVDVQTSCLSVYKQLFINLEEVLLSVENLVQMSLLHKVLSPLSSENYMSPNQLMLLQKAPPQQHYLYIHVRHMSSFYAGVWKFQLIIVIQRRTHKTLCFMSTKLQTLKTSVP